MPVVIDQDEVALWKACQEHVQLHLSTRFWDTMFPDKDADCGLPVRIRKYLVTRAFVDVFFQVTKYIIGLNSSMTGDFASLEWTQNIIKKLLLANPDDIRVPKEPVPKRQLEEWARLLRLNVSSEAFVQENWETKLFYLWTFLDDEFPLDWFEKIWTAQTIGEARQTLQESHPLVTNLFSKHDGEHHFKSDAEQIAETQKQLWQSTFARFEVVLGVEESQWAMLPARWIRVVIVATDGNQRPHVLEIWVNPGMADANTGMFGMIADAKGTWAVLRGDKGAGDAGTMVQTTDYAELEWEPLEVQSTPEERYDNADVHLPTVSQLSTLCIVWAEIACRHLYGQEKQAKEATHLALLVTTIATTRRPVAILREDALHEARRLHELEYHAIWELQPPMKSTKKRNRGAED